MDLNKLEELSKEQKIDMLSYLIHNDLGYWKKLILAMELSEEDDSEVIDMIIENKIREINFINKKYELKKDADVATRQKNLTKILGMILDDNFVDEKYTKVCKQVLEILKYIPREYYNKINPKFIAKIQKNVNVNYDFKIEEGTPFSEINMFEETKDLLLLISNKFFSNNDNIIYISEIYNNEVK